MRIRNRGRNQIPNPFLLSPFIAISIVLKSIYIKAIKIAIFTYKKVFDVFSISFSIFSLSLKFNNCGFFINAENNKN